MGLHASASPGGQKKIGQSYGTPQGRRHALTSAFLLIPMHSSRRYDAPQGRGHALTLAFLLIPMHSKGIACKRGGEGGGPL